MSKCKPISIDEYQKISKNNQVKLVDIRNQDEYLKEHIEGAENKTLDQLSCACFDESETVVFHCQSGNRTRQAIAFFERLGLKNIFILEGGLNAWKKAKLATEINFKAPFPVMRQVQIVVGFMVLLGIVLAYTVSPFFNFLSAFFGVGLIFAGISGTCALANILMMFPFNKQKNNGS